jgi:hypothetical protein
LAETGCPGRVAGREIVMLVVQGRKVREFTATDLSRIRT